MPFPLQDQGLGRAAQGGAFGQGGEHGLFDQIEPGGAGHGSAAEAGDPEPVTLEMTLAEVAVATGDTIDGEVFPDLDVRRIDAAAGDGLAIQPVEHPVMVLQILRGEAGCTAAGAEQKQGEQQ